MEERWLCSECEKEFDDVARRYDFDNTVTYICPFCESEKIEELEPCPTPMCGGWKPIGKNVCKKCSDRLAGALGRFARQFCPAELAELNDLMEGTGLEYFV